MGAAIPGSTDPYPLALCIAGSAPMLPVVMKGSLALAHQQDPKPLMPNG